MQAAHTLFHLIANTLQKKERKFFFLTDFMYTRCSLYKRLVQTYTVYVTYTYILIRIAFRTQNLYLKEMKRICMISIHYLLLFLFTWVLYAVDI